MNCGPLKILFLMVLGICQVHAGGVTLSSVGGCPFKLKDGAVLPQGCSVRIGSFNLPELTRDATLAAATEYAVLNAWFKPLAEGVATAGTATQPGGTGNCLCVNNFPAAGDIFGTISDISVSYMVPGTQIYLWVFNHANPAQATQWGIFTAAGWLTPQALGSQALSTTSAMQVVQGSFVSQQLRLRDIPVSYGNWTWQSYPGNSTTQTTDAAADPDGDGLANLAEYAWRLNPNAADPTRTTLTKGTDGSIIFHFKSPRNIPDVTVSVECSADLINWAPTTSVLISSDAEFDTLECTATPGTPCFWRVRFSANP